MAIWAMYAYGYLGNFDRDTIADTCPAPWDMNLTVSSYTKQVIGNPRIVASPGRGRAGSGAGGARLSPLSGPGDVATTRRGGPHEMIC